MIDRNLLAFGVVVFFLAAILWALEGCAVDCTMHTSTASDASLRELRP
jgi:hypothetical protein